MPSNDRLLQFRAAVAGFLVDYCRDDELRILLSNLLYRNARPTGEENDWNLYSTAVVAFPKLPILACTSQEEDESHA
ncbi:unnamed protein product [Bursaphelenchus xylophilus]|uniref:(pine wood nematode) hypothetical protein n=1 Tax=Bursaphelenchus xylophilus TaxID=6326 RepID=A0A1I7RV23_BURXY|nr:unnamed protein product [Bursaphelenchus xylophilus]CAG9105187.1 unnamed protein product [Bursaphelenchus xylophilus]